MDVPIVSILTLHFQYGLLVHVLQAQHFLVLACVSSLVVFHILLTGLDPSVFFLAILHTLIYIIEYPSCLFLSSCYPLICIFDKNWHCHLQGLSFKLNKMATEPLRLVCLNCSHDHLTGIGVLLHISQVFYFPPSHFLSYPKSRTLITSRQGSILLLPENKTV